MNKLNEIESMNKTLVLDSSWLKFYTSNVVRDMKKIVSMYNAVGISDSLMTSIRILSDDMKVVQSIHHVLGAHGDNNRGLK